MKVNASQMDRAVRIVLLLLHAGFPTLITLAVPPVHGLLKYGGWSVEPEQTSDTLPSTMATLRGGLETEKIIPALKRFHKIGSLYNDFKDDFVSYGIITGNLPNNTLHCSEDFETYFEETLVRSSSDRLRVLGFDLNVQASILSGLAEVTFDANVQTKKISDASHVVTLIAASAKTYTEMLDLGSPSLSTHLTQHRIRSSPANYVVSGVIYGYKYEIWLEQSLQSNSSTSGFGVDVAGELRKMTKLVTGSLRGRGRHKTGQKTDGKGVHMTILGDVSLPTSSITTYDELIAFVLRKNSEIEKIRHEKKGRPLYYILTPISVFQSILNISSSSVCMANLIEENVLQELISRFDAAEIAVIRLEEIRAKVSSLANCLVHIAIQKVVELVEAYKVALLDYKDSVKTAILKERQGLAGEVFRATTRHNGAPTGLKKTLENVTWELQNYDQTVTTYKYLHMNNVTCMSPEIASRDFAMRYWNSDVLLLIFKSDSINDHLSRWNRQVTDMIRVCSLQKLVCVFVDCQFAHPYCSGEIVPEVRLFKGGIRVYFRHILDNL